MFVIRERLYAHPIYIYIYINLPAPVSILYHLNDFCVMEYVHITAPQMDGAIDSIVDF